MPKLWILVGDASEARLFETQKLRKRWKLVREFFHPESRAKGNELLTDRLGRADERGELPKDLEASRFVIELADFLKRSQGQELFDQLFLVGPPKFLGMLRGRLSPPVLHRLRDALDKDYAKLKPRELQSRLYEQLFV
jgi:protein required for attachment to host cells